MSAKVLHRFTDVASVATQIRCPHHEAAKSMSFCRWQWRLGPCRLHVLRLLLQVRRRKAFGSRLLEAQLPDNLKILYQNWGTVSAAIVISHEIDRQECQEFIEHFKQMLESKILGKKANYQTPT